MLLRNQYSSNESFPNLVFGSKDDVVIAKSQGSSSNFRKELPLQCANSPISASQFPNVLDIDDIGPSLPSDLNIDELHTTDVASLTTAEEESDAGTLSASAETVLIEKPFFIMDFLDDVDPEDLELAQYMLQNTRERESLRESSKASQSSSICINMLQKLRPVQEKESKESRGTSGTSPEAGNDLKDVPQLCRNKSSFFDWSVAVGTKYNTKGICCASRGDWKKALQYWEDALEIRSQVLGESLDVANTCNNIGIALGKLNRYEEAITSLQRAINIRIGHYGWDHEIIAATLHNMGNVYQQQKQSDDDTSDCLSSAIYCFREAEYILQKVHGRYHAEVARSLVAVGHTYNQAHDRDEAQKAYLEALHIFEIIGYTIDHPEIQSILDDLNGLE